MATRLISIAILVAGCAHTACDQQAPQSIDAPITASSHSDPSNNSHAHVELAGQTYSMEIAADPSSISQGMMGRTAFNEGGGMLFVFAKPNIQRFWMAHCLIDIDLIYLDGRGRIVSMHRMVREPPRRPNESLNAYYARMPSYSSGRPVQFAIELPAGSIDRLGLKRSMPAHFDLDRLKAMATD